MNCRDRIANHLFDDPPRVVPPEPEKAKVALEMDDKKSHKVGPFLSTSLDSCCSLDLILLIDHSCAIHPEL